MQDSQTVSTPNEEPKRARRQRTPVTLLQHEYDVIYSYSNNHQSKSRKVKADDTENSNQKDGRSDSIEDTRPKSSKSTTSAYSSIEASNEVPSATTFQWIGEGTRHNKNDEGGSNRNRNANEDGGILYYQKVEIVVGGHPALIQVGDDVLVSSDALAESDLMDKGPTAVILRNLGLNKGGDDSAVNDGQGQSKVKPENVAMNKLEPYIGRVISMWEEGATKTKENDIVNVTDDRKDRMKVKVMWYYTREDVSRTKGVFIGVSRQKIMSFLTPRDVLLAEDGDADENDITTILGKCRVVRCKPPPPNDDNKREKSLSGKEGTFRCCYNIGVDVTGSKPKIAISPYDGPEDSGTEEDPLEECQPPNKRARSNNYQGSDVETMDDSQATESIEAAETEPEVMSMEIDGDDDDESAFLRGKPPIKMPPTTEGTSTQKILVGEDHQVTIPALVTGTYVASRQEIDLPPVMVWKPDAMSQSDLASFVSDASQILRAFLKDQGIEVSRSVPQNLDPKHLPSNYTCRELNVDAILQCLHQNGYDRTLALKDLTDHPEKFVFLWTKEEKALYNAGFRRHFSAIRSIAKGMANRTNKKHCDVVDYHYRFKIPDQFQRYEDKKREQAKRMLECVERHRLDEFLPPQSSATATHYSNMSNSMGSSNSNSGASASIALGSNKKTQSWSRTGGGPQNSVGALERRRLAARDFLVTVKNRVGVEQYLILVNHLKGLHARVITIPQCREAFASALEENHPELMKCFDEYLPQRFRDS